MPSTVPHYTNFLLLPLASARLWTLQYASWCSSGTYQWDVVLPWCTHRTSRPSPASTRYFSSYLFWHVLRIFPFLTLCLCYLCASSCTLKWILPPATTWSDEPTVDRTLAGLNFKSTITLAMSFSQFFAAGLRITLLLRDKLDTVQQEMMVKNLLFLVPSVSAVLKIYQTKGRWV